MTEEPHVLNNEAQQLLDALAHQMVPTGAEGSRAFDRLADAMAASARRPCWTRVPARLSAVWAHLGRIAIPVVALAAVVFFVRTIARNDIGMSAGIEDARLMLQDRRYRGAYESLAKHAQRFKTRQAAEARMPLVLDALCGMDTPDLAQAHLQRYLAQVPDSPLAARGDEICPLGTQSVHRLNEP